MSGWACVGLIVRVRLHPPPRTAQLAFNFVPTREAFEASLGGDARAGMAQFTTGFGPVLAEVQAFMVSTALGSVLLNGLFRTSLNGVF